MTPADLAAHIAAKREWQARFAATDPAWTRRQRKDAAAHGHAAACDDPPIRVRASDLEQILADARLLARLAADCIEHLTTDESAAIERHTYPADETT